MVSAWQSYSSYVFLLGWVFGETCVSLIHNKELSLLLHIVNITRRNEEIESCVEMYSLDKDREKIQSHKMIGSYIS